MSKFRVEIQLAFIVEAESEDDVESAVEEEMMGVGDVLAINRIAEVAP